MRQTESILLAIAAFVVFAEAVVAAFLLRRSEMARREAVSRVTETKTEFLSRISSEIKTPMNVIMGMTALGMEETDNPEKMAECLSRIDTASRFLMGLIDDLVDVSKIEAGRFRLHPKAYSFAEFQRSIRVMMEQECAAKGIAFHMNEEEIRINVRVDPMRFPQIFFNLLSNAVKFTPKGGEVTFQICNYATHNNLFSADYVVRDTGIGMAEDFQKFLFEPFSQEERVTAEKHHGSGLGLAIVRNIVDLMGGTIAVQSARGEGTEVKVHLDLELAQVQPEETKEYNDAEETRRILRGKRVLLVEDHPMNIEIARRMLERQEIEVVCVEEGRLGVEEFKRREPRYYDAIIMDIQLPEMDGCEAARLIRASRKSDALVIPIIAMSANSSHEDVEASKEAGMNAHISKPVDPQTLYSTLCEFLEAPL